MTGLNGSCPPVQRVNRSQQLKDLSARTFLKAGDIYWPVVFTNAETVTVMQLPSIHKQCLPQDNVVILCTLFFKLVLSLNVKIYLNIIIYFIYCIKIF